MRNRSIFAGRSGDMFIYPPFKWDESGISLLTLDDPNVSNRVLEQLYQEAQEYVFLNEENSSFSGQQGNKYARG